MKKSRYSAEQVAFGRVRPELIILLPPFYGFCPIFPISIHNNAYRLMLD